MPQLLNPGNQGEEEGVTPIHGNMNSYQKAVLSVEESTPTPTPIPAPTVSTDYYYGNPLAYACKAAKQLCVRQGS